MKNREPQWYIDNKLKPPKAFFDWCYSQIDTFKWSNKEKTILASDRKNCHVIEKRLTKRSKLTFFHKFYSFGIILVTAKRIELQTYCFWSEVKDGKQEIEMQLANFERLSDDQHIKVTHYGDEKYLHGLVALRDNQGPYTGLTLYPNNWRERIETISELKYLEFPYGKPFDQLSHFYKYRTEIEFLQKINARKLSEEVMYPSTIYGSFRKTVDMRTINEKWLRENKQFFKNSDRDFMEFELERRIKQRNGKVVPGIEEYLDYRDINHIPDCVGIISFQNWMIKNDINFQYYKDYLNLLKDMEVAVDTKNIAMPKDLTVAHNHAVDLYNQMEKEIEERKFEKRKKALVKLEREIDDYKIVAPLEPKELIQEGKKLSHCVGGSGYVDRHRKGELTILFIRRKDRPNEPFYTMEYRSGRIVQIRGKRNASAPEEIKKVAEEWKASIN